VNRPSATPGICRIDQPHKHNHGFFVRRQRAGKVHSGFFADLKHGGRKAAFKAAVVFRNKLAAKLGARTHRNRKRNAMIVRRPGRSGIHGVQKYVDRRVRPVRSYWKATWSPEPGKIAKKQYSIRKHGDKKARQLAIRARRAGVRSMK